MNKSTKIIAAVVAVAAFVGGYLLFRKKPATVVKPPAISSVSPRAVQAVSPPEVRFTDVTEAAGIRFAHFNGARGKKLLPETMGSGCAFIDYDNDGDQDLLLVNCSGWPDDPAVNPTPTTALYQNDGKGHFSDVSVETGVNHTFYGMGVAAGDYDNDGWIDLYLTGVRRNILLHNERGRFVDATRVSGTGGTGGWSTGATFFDYDNDGNLDLWVCNYITWTPEIDLAQDFQIAGVGRAYGPPMNFAGAFSILYRGDGTGRFEDVSAKAGIQVRNRDTSVPMGKGLGVITCDFDSDGHADVVVANDTVFNFLFHNRGDGTFKEDGMACGVATDETGAARGAMGIDAGDFGNDGMTGVAIANFANEMTALFAPLDAAHPMAFTDTALAAGVGAPSRLLLKFGMFFDYDLDGRLDLLSANGHLDPDIEKTQASQKFAQSAQLFWNCGPEQAISFVEVPPSRAGGDLFKPIVGRGSAFADIDGDGDLDVVMTHNGGRPLLLRNDCVGQHWVRVALVGTGKSNRSAIGARVEMHAGGIVQRREVRGGRSYLSQSELAETFGLGKATKVEKLMVRWPDGQTETFAAPAVDTMHTIMQGTGR